MLIAIPKEITPNETRVALSPKHVAHFSARGYHINIEDNAGLHAGFSNEQYLKAGASICKTAQQTYAHADLILKIWAPLEQEIQYLSSKSTIICNTQNLKNNHQLKTFSRHRINIFALDLIPRISRAQNMDILSSQDTLSGYESVILGASCSSQIMPLLMTAAGTIPPMKVLIIGLGVAGLQAAATAHRIGAQVYAFDKRPETQEQTASIGAIFIEKLTTELLSTFNLITTSAQIRGKTAPKVLSDKQYKHLNPSCVIIDMAIDSGGNIDKHKLPPTVKLIQDSHLSRHIPHSASTLYSENMFNFCQFLIKENKIQPDFNDEIIEKTAICWQGQIHHPYLTGQ